MNAWGEPDEPNPVTQIIAVRTAQIGGTAGILLAALFPVCPAPVFGVAALAGGITVAVGLSGYFIKTFNPRTMFPGCPLLVRLPDDGNAVALTFDDGPHPDTTPRILDALAAGNAHATFFVVGERASRFPEIVRRIAREGHTIGVHGLRHRTMVLQNAAQIERDLTEAVVRIEDATGEPLPHPILLRPPYGFKSATLAQTAHRLGFKIAAWSLDPRDYDPVDGAMLSARIAARIVPSDIVLLHERPELPAAVDALPQIIADCRKRGLSLVGIAGDSTHKPLGQCGESHKNHHNP